MVAVYSLLTAFLFTLDFLNRSVFSWLGAATKQVDDEITEP